MATKKRPVPKSKKPTKKASAPAPSKKAASAGGTKAKAAKATKTKSTAASKKPSNNGAKVKPKAPAPKRTVQIAEPVEHSEAAVDLVKLAKDAALKRLMRR